MLRPGPSPGSRVRMGACTTSAKARLGQPSFPPLPRTLRLARSNCSSIPPTSALFHRSLSPSAAAILLGSFMAADNTLSGEMFAWLALRVTTGLAGLTGQQHPLQPGRSDRPERERQLSSSWVAAMLAFAVILTES